MAEASNFLATQRIAVVSGGNKGIGLEICRQLASKGILVILTARDIKKGNEAVINMLKMDGHSNYYIIFHQLDVTDISGIVNNAAILGVLLDKDFIISPQHVRNEWAIGILNDCDKITGDKVDEVM
ncbi:hypothetical protein RDI58_002289 [Solanum bulbocastanum]|uniref:Uncharacterized protein n=1 Tax=Solanum bulbocastanum TaxID=147425 RepID=A0AAN8UE38_SOLBU